MTYSALSLRCRPLEREPSPDVILARSEDELRRLMMASANRTAKEYKARLIPEVPDTRPVSKKVTHAVLRSIADRGETLARDIVKDVAKRRDTVTMVLGELRKNGLVELVQKRVNGKGSNRKYYALTELGRVMVERME